MIACRGSGVSIKTPAAATKAAIARTAAERSRLGSAAWKCSITGLREVRSHAETHCRPPRVRRAASEYPARPGDQHRVRPGQPGADPLQAIGSGLHRVRCHLQRAAHKLVIVTIVQAHSRRSSTGRSADLARAVCLLTALVLIPIAEAT